MQEIHECEFAPKPSLSGKQNQKQHLRLQRLPTCGTAGRDDPRTLGRRRITVSFGLILFFRVQR